MFNGDKNMSIVGVLYLALRIARSHHNMLGKSGMVLFRQACRFQKGSRPTKKKVVDKKVQEMNVIVVWHLAKAFYQSVGNA